ncbi:MAG TPA: GNAT family N-acetyltransferase [Saliniramus sp.]|nr:GNAT family N-acetyltransferase [Saliniramus sp.]
MKGDEPALRVRIEEFDPKIHDRDGFSCGVERVDNFFKATANKLAGAGNLKLYVMISPEGETIGFHAINAHAIHYADLPAKFARTRPGHGMIPAAFIAMIGRDVRFRGQSYGADLPVDALRKIARASETLGLAAVLLDVLDCGDRDKTAARQAMYSAFGFVALASNPLRMYLPMSNVFALIAEIDESAQ